MPRTPKLFVNNTQEFNTIGYSEVYPNVVVVKFSNTDIDGKALKIFMENNPTVRIIDVKQTSRVVREMQENGIYDILGERYSH
jgi:hypothetical protein